MKVNNKQKQRVITHGFFLFAVIYIFSLDHLIFPLKTLLKPLPIFILLYSLRNSELPEDKWSILLWALVCSASGDIALTFHGQESFLVGIGFFALAHVAYIILFFDNLQLKAINGLIISSLLMLSGLIFNTLAPHLGSLQGPVTVYMLLLLGMVITALLNQSVSKIVKVGALLFLCSDTLLAMNQFLSPKIALTPMVMSTYYLAQFLIVRGMAKSLNKPLPLAEQL